MMKSEIEKLSEKVTWKEMTPGTAIYGSGTSVYFHTGSWRVDTPEFIEDKC